MINGMRFYRARFLSSHIITYESYGNDWDACIDACIARKKELGTSVDFFPVGIPEVVLEATSDIAEKLKFVKLGEQNAISA